MSWCEDIGVNNVNCVEGPGVVEGGKWITYEEPRGRGKSEKLPVWALLHILP